MDRPVARRSLLTLAGGLLLQSCAAGSPAQAAGRKSDSAAPAAARPVAAKRSSGASHSGLPWMSGITGSVLTRDAADEIDALESFRGRKMDVQTTFANWHLGWDKWLKAQFWRAGLPQLLAERGIRVAHSTPLLCGGSEGQFAECARGDFDEYHRTIAKRWKELGHPTPIIRLGWETTLEHYPWNALRDDTPGYGKYKDAFRRIADIYHHELPGCEIDWNNLRGRRPTCASSTPATTGSTSSAPTSTATGRARLFLTPIGTRSPTTSRTTARADRSRSSSSPSRARRSSRWRNGPSPTSTTTRTALTTRPLRPRHVGVLQRLRRAPELRVYFNRKGENGDHRIYPSDFNPRASAAYKKAWQP